DGAVRPDAAADLACPRTGLAHHARRPARHPRELLRVRRARGRQLVPAHRLHHDPAAEEHHPLSAGDHLRGHDPAVRAAAGDDRRRADPVDPAAEPAHLPAIHQRPVPRILDRRGAAALPRPRWPLGGHLPTHQLREGGGRLMTLTGQTSVKALGTDAVAAASAAVPSRRRRRSARSTGPAGTVLRYLASAVVVLAALLPLAWMTISGFKARDDVVTSPFQFFPDIWQPQNYVAILQDPAFVRALGLTFTGAILFTALSLT